MRFEKATKRYTNRDYFEEEVGIEHDIELEFREFHEKNPHIYDHIVHLATLAREKGKRIGIGCLWEMLRWHLSVETTGDKEMLRWHLYVEVEGDDTYKLNNNHRSRYARLIMEQEGDLAGFFNVRTLRS